MLHKPRELRMAALLKAELKGKNKHKSFHLHRQDLHRGKVLLMFNGAGPVKVVQRNASCFA